LKGDAKTKESLERLKNQLEQARISGNTDLAKKINAILDRLKNEQNQPKKTSDRSR
jgi:hypothetical protein